MATEKRLIWGDIAESKLKKLADHYHGSFSGDAFERAMQLIAELPSVDAVEVVHGYWDDSGRYQFPSGKKAIRCSICGCALSESEFRLFNWNYCPVCGANMDLKGE